MRVLTVVMAVFFAFTASAESAKYPDCFSGKARESENAFNEFSYNYDGENEVIFGVGSEAPPPTMAPKEAAKWIYAPVSIRGVLCDHQGQPLKNYELTLSRFTGAVPPDGVQRQLFDDGTLQEVPDSKISLRTNSKGRFVQRQLPAGQYIFSLGTIDREEGELLNLRFRLSHDVGQR